MNKQEQPFLPTNSRKETQFNMGTEMVMVDEIPFPTEITSVSGKPLKLVGQGITDIEIHFLQIKFTAIGLYFEEASIIGNLSQWKGKSDVELEQDQLFYEAVISCPVEKVIRVVVIKELKGSQYGVQLQSSVRDRLVEEDKYEDEEEEELEKVYEFFQSKYLKKDSVITFAFHGEPTKGVEITFTTEGKEESKVKIGNGNVVEMIQKWYLGGERSVSPTTVKSLTQKLAGILSAA